MNFMLIKNHILEAESKLNPSKYCKGQIVFYWKAEFEKCLFNRK